ncbi:unnamed protein product [Rhizophagus irregularis]|nr:unnamed protein product [Rhizophagus irregularis]
MLVPIIQINTSRRDELDVSTTLQKIYYQPVGYQRNAKKLLEVSLKAGYDFNLDEVRDWLERQLLHLLHKFHPRYIPQASFSSITTPNEMHQADVLYTRHIKPRRTIYLFYLNVKDVALRYEAIVLIGVAFKGPAKSIKNMQGILTSSTIAKCLEKIYDDPENPLIWPKVFLSDGERFYSVLDAYDLLDTFSDIIELKDLAGVVDSIVEDLNNSVTRLLSMTSTEAIKKKSVFAKPSKPRKGPVGYDEERLSYDNSVIYLLDSSEYEGGRRHATNMN